MELCMTLGSQMILAAGKAESTEQAREMLQGSNHRMEVHCANWQNLFMPREER